MEILIYYVLVPLFILGVAINIHELGHFLVAKLFGMRVEAYSFFGLGPRLFGFKWGHTDYRISAIPLGAYVKLYGDEGTAPLEGGSSEEKVESFLEQRNIGQVDEEKHAKFVVPESELYELRPRWQKFFVMIGGPFMNVVLALAIPFVSAMMYGVPAMPTPIVGAIKTDGASAQAGVKTGDRIVAFNGRENPTWRQIEVDAALRPGQEVPIVVERAGQRIPLNVTPSKVEMSGQNFGVLDIEPDAGVKPVVIGQVESGSPAAESGLQTGDRVVSINGTNIRNWQQLVTFVQENKAAPLNIQIERNNQNVDLTATVRKLSDGKERLGIAPAQISVPREPASIATAFTHAVNTNLEILSMTGTALGQVFTGNRSARDTVSGPVGIFQQSAQAAQAMGWEGIFAMLMAISLSLGIFNLLPIPMLDGGQIMVLGIEGVLALFGMQLSMLVRERIQMAGLAIILLLMVTVMFVDISRIVGR